jgi:hypothetical protein
MIDSMLTVKLRKPTKHELNNCNMVDITSVQPWNPSQYSDDDDLDEAEYIDLMDKVEDARQNQAKLSKTKEQQVKDYSKYFLHPGKEVMKKTIQNTTRYGSINMRFPMRQHYKSRNPLLQRRRLLEPFSTDTWFSTVTS